MQSKFRVTDAINFDPYPTAHAHIRWAIKLLRRFVDEHFLNADCRGHGDGDVPVAVMIVRKHREHFLPDKPSRLAVIDLLPSFRQPEANSSHALDLLLA